MDKVVAAEVKFPVLQFHQKGNYMWIVPTAEKFGECNAVGLRRGCFDEMTVVDSEGKSFRVVGIRSTRCAGSKWQRPFLSLLFDYKPLSADLELSLPVPVPLDEFKSKIIEYIDMQREMWESGIGVPEIKAAVRAAKTHRDAIEVIYGGKID